MQTVSFTINIPTSFGQGMLNSSNYSIEATGIPPIPGPPTTTSIAASLSGRVLTPDARGLRNAVVTITDPQGMKRTALTSSLGFYSFADVVPGQQYILSASSKRYRFLSRQLLVTGNQDNVEFVGIE